MLNEKLTSEQQDMIRVIIKALPYLRKEMGISQTELGIKIGLSRQMLSLIERGEQQLTWTQFLAIVFFFKCNNDFIKGERIYKKNPNAVEMILLLESNMQHTHKKL